MIIDDNRFTRYKRKHLQTTQHTQIDVNEIFFSN